jgi:Putative DNA-binding domain
MIFQEFPVPALLKRKQQWFANIIVQPLDHENRISFQTPSGRSIEEEASDYIASSPALKPFERIEIYNQQFWWRILNSLHDTFPIATRLFGYEDFNHIIGIPYIKKYLPNHWSLSFLGDRLSQWVEEEYRRDDKELVSDAVSIDWAYNNAFMAAHYPSLGAKNIAEPETLMMKNVLLQPHLKLFELDYDLFKLRKEFLTFDPEYWLVNDFPKICRNKSYYFVLYRSRENLLVSEDVTEGEYRLLQKFETGNTIEHAVDWLVKQKNLREEASNSLHLWLEKWIVNQWLAISTET